VSDGSLGRGECSPPTCISRGLPDRDKRPGRLQGIWQEPFHRLSVEEEAQGGGSGRTGIRRSGAEATGEEGRSALRGELHHWLPDKSHWRGQDHHPSGLKESCERAGIKAPSESTIGRIIHDLKGRGRLPRKTRVAYNAKTGRLRIWEAGPGKRKTRRKGFHPSRPGDLVEIDTVDIFVDGLKRYLLTAIDLPTRFAFAYTYKSSSSSTARDFLGKLKMVAPFPIVRVQTDNGHEFLKHFATASEQERLVHFFNYPRHPQSNAHLEHFNRTIQEQFAQANTHLLDEPALFNRELMHYLLWYNTERRHRAIGNVAPLRYYLDKFATPPRSNIPWTLTPA